MGGEGREQGGGGGEGSLAVTLHMSLIWPTRLRGGEKDVERGRGREGGGGREGKKKGGGERREKERRREEKGRRERGAGLVARSHTIFEI